MSLAADTLETTLRLTALIVEETRALAARAATADLKAFADEKALLGDRIAVLGEAMKRAGKAALLAEPPSMRTALAEAMAALNTALTANGKVLARRKSLSEGLIDAVLVEARRQAGTQLSAYGRAAPRTEKAAAIACNTQI